MPKHDVEIVADGSFGQEVAAQLTVLGDDDGVIVPAAHLSWLPIVLEPGRVRVGPVFTPGAAPCPQCYDRRLAQYRPSEQTGGTDLAERADASGNTSVGNTSGGGGDYPPHLAAIAAGLALTLAGAQAPAGPGRRLFLIDTATDLVGAHQLIPVHGCPGCDPPDSRAAADAGRADRLRALVAGLRPALID